MIVYAVDPGITGAIACANCDELIGVLDMPVRVEATGRKRVDSAGVAHLIREWRKSHPDEAEIAIIEKVSAMPSQGVTSMFSLGHSAGVAEAVFATLGIRVELVAPATWKRALGLTADKAMSRGRASQMFPADAGLWALKKHDGRAEAVLLAAFGFQRFA